jgi:predicted ATPase/DNA-binding SARP family transcriptional activator
VELRVLGELHAGDDGRVIEFRPVERRLLAALAVRRSGPVGYDVLSDAVWGEAVPRSATRSLQTHVLRIRAAAGQDMVETVSGGYRLGQMITVDVDRFTASMRAAGDVAGGAAAVARWDGTLALWRGVPFVDLDDWEPAVAERSRLFELRHRALEERCAVALGVLPVDEVVAEADRLVAAEPLRERRWALLMSSLHAGGRRADALRAFDRARRLLATELGISPGHELVELHQELLCDTDDGRLGEVTSMRQSASRGNLPVPLTTMIGRDKDLARLASLVDQGRLVTLTGTGGVGKSRLALALGEQMREEVSGGVWFVELAKTHDPATVDPLIAHILGLVGGDGRTVRDGVVGTIGDRHLMLILDNCEHLLSAVADFVSDALVRCRRLRILTTSREPLAVPGERTVVVPSLPVDAAAQLFLARTRDADPEFNGQDGSLVAAISRQLDGIPLAIELAAARVRTIGIEELARNLDSRPHLVAGSRRDRDERHRTMRAALDWSYELLTDAERIVFRRLAVFRGRFELEAVEQVVADDVHGDEDVATVLASLVDKSMVVADGDHPARYRLLEPLRQYAADRLTSSDAAQEVADRHARHFAALASRLDDAVRGPDELTAARRFDAARDNLRAAFGTAVDSGDLTTALTLGVSLWCYAGSRVWAEPWSWCDIAIALPGAVDHPLWPAALLGASDGAWQLGDHRRCVELADTAISLVETRSEIWCEAHRIKAAALVWLGRFDEAVESASAAVDRQTAEVTYATLLQVSVLALILNAVGRPQPQLAQQLLDDAKTVGNPTGLALALHTAGVILGDTDPQRSVNYQRQAVEVAASTGAVLIEGFALATLAGHASEDDPLGSARAHHDVVAHYLRVGNRTHLRGFARGLIRPFVSAGCHHAAAVVDGATSDQPELGELEATRSALLDTARKALGGDNYRDAAEHGATMTDDELVAFLDDAVSMMENSPASASHRPRPYLTR